MGGGSGGTEGLRGGAGMAVGGGACQGRVAAAQSAGAAALVVLVVWVWAEAAVFWGAGQALLEARSHSSRCTGGVPGAQGQSRGAAGSHGPRCRDQAPGTGS